MDWLSDNMYFSSFTSDHASISVSKLNGVYRTQLLSNAKPNTVENSLHEPASLVLHPTYGAG